MDRGAWWATAYGVTKSLTWLKRLSTQHRQFCNMIDQDGNMHHLKARGWTMTWNPTETTRNGEGINLSRSADVPRRTDRGGLAAKVLDVPHGGGLKDTG